MKRWLLTTKPTAPQRTSKTAGGTNANGGPDGTSRVSTGTTDPEKQAQMLKMISALQELYKTMNSTLRMRITLIPRANGKNPGRKNKGMPAEGSVRPSMVPPMEMGNTTSRTSAEVLMPSSLTGRNFKKVLPSQPKKPNKRVCFWKYCSQN
ncbi:urotensin II-related peptide [Lampris incognitus]|uniref:urotensin II-related peptide n=1 Tax=Lampris incognitus TaxID=2546036 RepID=UPI0024B58379|nr:urotensin II-related peptide [Lampris incognitus]